MKTKKLTFTKEELSDIEFSLLVTFVRLEDKVDNPLYIDLRKLYSKVHNYLEKQS